MLDYPFDTQLLIEGKASRRRHPRLHSGPHPGDCLLAVGDESLVKIHFTPTSPGRCWSTALPWGRSTTL